nr:hypothetical protein [Tanacetum cinerariifolium]
MVAYLTKSDASERFNQVIDFLNGSYIKYALTINPNIYVSCIKQFWNTVAIKQVNDVTRLQALVDKKKVVVTEAAIREVLQLDDAEGVDCLPNKDIFAELARMGYEKPSTKLTFYKALFSSQWKFLIHTILQSISAKQTSWNVFSSTMTSAVICLSTGRKFNFSKYIFDSLVRNVDSTSKFYMYPRFIQLLIRKQVGDLSTHTKKYISPVLTQKVFSNMRRVGKGFSGVETPLFEGMIVGQEIEEGGDAEEHVEDVTAGDASQGDDTTAYREVPTVSQEPSIPSPTPPTPPPQPPQDLPSTSQVHHTLPQSPQVQQPSSQPQAQQQATDFPMSLLQEALDAYAALTGRVEHLEYDKEAQALEITKLKRRVKKLEKGNKVKMLKLQRLKRVGTSQRVDTSEDTMMDDASKQGRIIDEIDKDDEDEPAKVQEVVDVVTTVKLITEVVTAASTIISAAEPQVPAATITAAPVRVAAASTRRRKRVVIKDPEEESTPSSIIPADIKSKDKGKGNMQKAKEDPTVQRYQVMKRKPQTEAQAQKNMIMYLKNVAGFRLDYFKGMSYDDIQEEEVEDLKIHLEIVPDEDDDVYTEATPLARKVPIVDYDISKINNKPYYKIIRADGTHQLFISFLTLLKNFDREDLEALWNLVKERFSKSKPKNFSDDFLRTTLGAMFEKLDAQAQVWKIKADFVGRKKIPTLKVYTRSNAECKLSVAKEKLMMLDSAAERSLMLLSQVKTVNDKCNGYHQRDKIQAKPDKTKHKMESMKKSKVNQSQQKVNPTKSKPTSHQVKEIQLQGLKLPKLYTYTSRTEVAIDINKLRGHFCQAFKLVHHKDLLCN